MQIEVTQTQTENDAREWLDNFLANEDACFAAEYRIKAEREAEAKRFETLVASLPPMVGRSRKQVILDGIFETIPMLAGLLGVIFIFVPVMLTVGYQVYLDPASEHGLLSFAVALGMSGALTCLGCFAAVFSCADIRNEFANATK